MAAAVHGQRLPVKAAIEGPAACFRLLEIDSDLGMRHDQFVGLLMSATDNRRDSAHLFGLDFVLDLVDIHRQNQVIYRRSIHEFAYPGSGRLLSERCPRSTFRP